MAPKKSDDNSGDDAVARFASTPPLSTVPGWYPELLSAVSDSIKLGHTQAISRANQELVHTYWKIGSELLAREALDGWGAKVVTRLSADLRERFPQARGYSPRNLRYMKSFAAAWPESAMLQQPVATLPWGHNAVLIDRLTDADTRLWYAAHATEGGGPEVR